MICERTRGSSRLVNANGPSRLVPSVISNPSTVSVRRSVNGARIVDQDVDVTVDQSGEGAYRSQVGKVELDDGRRAADLGRALSAKFGVADGQDHVGTGVGQSAGRTQADAVGRPGHDDSFAGQVAEPARRPR